MASNLIAVTLTAPVVDPNIAVDGTFDMTITGTYQGGGSVTAHDFYWEFDQGTDNWITIPASGGTLGLYTDDVNPLVGKVTTDAETIVITGDKAGVYKIRAHGVRGANNYYDPDADPNSTLNLRSIFEAIAHTSSS